MSMLHIWINFCAESYIALMDESLFKAKPIQRVYRYLKLRKEGNSEGSNITLDNFFFEEKEDDPHKSNERKYDPSKPVGSEEDFIQYMLEYSLIIIILYFLLYILEICLQTIQELLLGLKLEILYSFLTFNCTIVKTPFFVVLNK